MEAISPQLLRIVDASTNRIGEGLRLLEEVARLVLGDADLTQQLKSLRHGLVAGDWPIQQQFLQARDSEADVGASMGVPGAPTQRELPTAVVANARRVQESLRVLEELAKIPGIPLSADKFREARFSLYTIEKALVSRLLRRDKTDRIRGLYVVIDMPSLKGRSAIDVAQQAIRGGAKIVQLRAKLQSKKDLLPVARQLRDLCAKHKALFIVNDHLDLALAVGADGLHVGQDDLPAKVARRLLPIDKLLGVSVFTVKQATLAQSEGADYIAVGSIFATASKEIKVVGVDRLRQVRQAVTLPLVAIGGINRENMAPVLAAGADSVAVISAILGAEDVAGAARQIAGRFKDERTDG